MDLQLQKFLNIVIFFFFYILWRDTSGVQCMLPQKQGKLHLYAAGQQSSDGVDMRVKKSANIDTQKK